MRRRFCSVMAAFGKHCYYCNSLYKAKAHLHSDYVAFSVTCVTVSQLPFEDSLPGGFLLQPGNIGNIEHDSKEEQWLIAKLVQLLLEGFLEFHPTFFRGLGLPLEPQSKVMCLNTGGEETKISCVSQKEYKRAK